MSAAPGPRTRPTIKPLVTMNKKNLNDWEIKLGFIQTVALLAVISVSILSAFAFGLFTGKRRGFDAALATSISQAPRIPIVREQIGENAAPEDISRVYAKLGTSSLQPADTLETSERKEGGLSPIKTTGDEPVLEGLAEDLIGKTVKQQDARLKDELAASEKGALSEQAPSNFSEVEKKTLGSMISESEDSAQKSAVIKRKTDEPKVKEVRKEIVADVPVPKKEVAKVVVAKQKPQVKNKQDQTPVKSAPVRPSIPETKLTSPKMASAFVKHILPSGWYAQVSAPRDLKDADSLARQLHASGFRSVVEKAHVRGQEYFRVLVGPEDTREQAARLKGQLGRERYLRGDPFIRRIR